MTRTAYSSERGIAGLVLIIVIAWALGAVLMLSRTLVTAQQIDDRVDALTHETKGIGAHTAEIVLLETTNELAAKILDAARPLSAQLKTVNSEVASIDRTVVSILGNVQSIHGTVGNILGNVSGILTTARSIDAGVVAINAKADDIRASVRGIKSDTGNVLHHVGEIRQHARNIDKAPS